jgi:hypothetical protein
MFAVQHKGGLKTDVWHEHWQLPVYLKRKHTALATAFRSPLFSVRIHARDANYQIAKHTSLRTLTTPHQYNASVHEMALAVKP